MLNKVDVPEARELAELVRADLEARGLQVFAGQRRDPRRAARADLRAWPTWSRRPRARPRRPEATRIVLRPTAVDDAGFTVVARRASRVPSCAGSKPERWVRQTDFSNDEAVGYLADRLARLGVEDALLAAGAAGRRRGRHRRGRARRWSSTGSPRCRPAPSCCTAAAAPTCASRAADHRWRRRRGGRAAARRRRQGRLVVADHAPAGGLDAAPRRRARRRAGRRPASAGREVVLVSSGAIAAGLAPLGLRQRPRDLATQQAAASVGQGLLVHRYTEAFARHGLTVGQVLLTADDVVRRAHYRNAQRTLDRLLELGVVPVVNENDTVATDEIRFGDNDRLAALVAHLVHADLLVLLSDVDGLYDGDPRRPGAADARRGVAAPATSTGSGSGAPAAPASAPAAWPPRSRRPGSRPPPASAPCVAAAGRRRRGARGSRRRHGRSTRPARRLPTRLLWLAHATTPRGRLRLDAGAVRGRRRAADVAAAGGGDGGRGRLRRRRPGGPS